ncbi:MAG: coproporphyrinogen dehydrogenase HemZ [Ruminococcaceae bacterium]|nr:coproporphyrinogen dehydrogenase HemZ [Oscillospiraceae bacterium]
MAHNYKYAAEQALITFFPGEKHEEINYAPKSGKSCIIKLCNGNYFLSCSCIIISDNKRFCGIARLRLDSISKSKVKKESAISGMIKKAVYKAALSYGINPPAWGSLTGVRPCKLMSEILLSSKTEKAAKTKFIRKYSVSDKRADLCLEAAEQSIAVSNSLGDRDICLYVGIPFCPTRCNYCSFISASTEKSMKLIEPYLLALYEEIAAVSKIVSKLGLRVTSVYFGGGTPTTLSAEELYHLLTHLTKSFDLRNISEFTVEAGRPDTITLAKLQVLSNFNVSRISVNPQSMNDRVLDAIGRKHTARDIVSALEMVRSFNNFSVNMDLIAGLYSDSVSGFQESLNTVLDLRPENITVHTLSIKKGSFVKNSDVVLPNETAVLEMTDYSISRLYESGYKPYYLYRQKYMSGGFENIGWTIPGFENLYNIAIMEELCSIISLGCGGSTKLISKNKKMERFFNPKYPTEYIERIQKICIDKERINEYYGL